MPPREVLVSDSIVADEIDREEHPLIRNKRHQHVVAVARSQVVKLDRAPAEAQRQLVREGRIRRRQVGVASFRDDGKRVLLGDDRHVAAELLPQHGRPGGVVGVAVAVDDGCERLVRDRSADGGRQPRRRVHRNRVEGHHATVGVDEECIVRAGVELVDAVGDLGGLGVRLVGGRGAGEGDQHQGGDGVRRADGGDHWGHPHGEGIEIGSV